MQGSPARRPPNLATHSTSSDLLPSIELPDNTEATRRVPRPTPSITPKMGSSSTSDSHSSRDINSVPDDEDIQFVEPLPSSSSPVPGSKRQIPQGTSPGTFYTQAQSRKTAKSRPRLGERDPYAVSSSPPPAAGKRFKPVNATTRSRFFVAPGTTQERIRSSSHRTASLDKDHPIDLTDE